MSYLFSDMQSKLSGLLGDSNTAVSDMFPLANRKKEINRGEMQFAKDTYLAKEYATGTISSAQIAMPSDWLETFVLIVNNYIITNDREVSIKDYDRYYNYTGNPPYYYYWEFSGIRYIKFFGASTGQTYKLYYFKKPSIELSSDSDVSIFSEEFREAPAYYAAAELLQQVGKQQTSDKYRQIYMNFVREAQKKSERTFIDKQYPVPDVNMVGGSSTDVEGGGYNFGGGNW